MATLIGILVLALALVTGHRAVGAVRREPRRLANAALLATALGLLMAATALLGDRTAAQLVFLVLSFSPVLVLVLVGFLLANGFTMVRKEGRSLGNLLSLLAGVGIAGAVVVCFVLLWDDTANLPWALWIFLVCAWASAVFTGYLVYGWLYRRVSAVPQPDFIVTLGSGLIGDRVPPLLARRIDRALEIYQSEKAAGRRPVLVMSGGKGADERVSEALAMGRYARDRGVDAGDLLLEDQSVNTEQNLRHTTALVRADERLGCAARGVAVTSNYHVMRAASLARQVGAPVQVVAAPTAGYFWPSAVLREFVAVLRDSWRWQLLALVLVTVPLPLAFALAIG